MIAGLAVFDAFLAAAIVGHHAADGADFARSGVGGHDVAGLHRLLFKITVVTAGLDRAEVSLDRNYLVHVAGEVEDDAGADRAAGHVGAGRAGCDGEFHQGETFRGSQGLTLMLCILSVDPLDEALDIGRIARKKNDLRTDFKKRLASWL